MWKRIAVVGVVACLAMAAPAAAQDIQPPPSESDPSGCNEYHRIRDNMDTLDGSVPDQFQTDGLSGTEPVVADPLFDLLASQVLWVAGVYPCK